MGTVIIAIILGIVALVGIAAIIFGKREDSFAMRASGITLAAVGGIGFFLTFLLGTWVSNDVGRATLFVDSINRQIVGDPITSPVGGPFLKSPFVDSVEFDLRQQELLYAGVPGNVPEWVGNRKIDGGQVTAQVGGAAANMDVTVNYQLRPDRLVDIYSQYGSQEAFEIQVVKDQALSTIRQIPSNYTTGEFRGSKKGEAEDRMSTVIQDRLANYVTGVAVSIQDVRYSADIETRLQEVEQAKQEAEKARAAQERQRVENATAKEKAETDNAIKIANAKAEAEANEELAKSLTPGVLEARRIEALKEAQTIYVPYEPTIIAK